MRPMADSLPPLILGAAAQMSKIPGSMRLVGIVYENVGIMLAYFGEDKLLAISAEPSIFFNAMQTVNDALPDLIRELQIGRKTIGAVKSVVDAGEIAELTSRGQLGLHACSLMKLRTGRQIIRGRYRVHTDLRE